VLDVSLHGKRRRRNEIRRQSLINFGNDPANGRGTAFQGLEHCLLTPTAMQQVRLHRALRFVNTSSMARKKHAVIAVEQDFQ
jgi:hypothetical protein